MDVPWHSKSSKCVRLSRLLITLGSLILLYIETMPAFNRYGTNTRMCRQIVSFHCNKVKNTTIDRLKNPMCFKNETNGYKGCRQESHHGTDYEQCGFPNVELGFSCHANHTENSNIHYIDEKWWISKGLDTSKLWDGQAQRYTPHKVRICERLQCMNNDREDHSFTFQFAETILVSIFVIELLMRMIASTRPGPSLETTRERRVRRSLHWTWSRLFQSMCGATFKCFEGCCGCCCDYHGQGTNSGGISNSIRTLKDSADVVHGKDHEGLEGLVEEKHADEPVIYGLCEWISQVTNQLDTIAVTSAAFEVIWVPITFGAFKYEVWGFGPWFDPAVFRVIRVFVSARFISMERFFDDTTAIRKTIAQVFTKLLAPLFFLFVFVLIMSSMFLWVEVTLSANFYKCDDWDYILESDQLTEMDFHSHCTKCLTLETTVDYSDDWLGTEERYNGTCRRLVEPSSSTEPHRRVEPYVQTFAEAVWFMFVTVTTTGYGRDGIPATYLGRILMCFTSIMGTLYLAMPLSVVSSKFFEIFTKMREAAKHKSELKRKMTMKRLHALHTNPKKRSSPSWNKQASKLTFKMIVTLKMMAHRVRRRSMVRAPLTITQQHLILDYEDQVFVIHEQLWSDNASINNEDHGETQDDHQGDENQRDGQGDGQGGNSETNNQSSNGVGKNKRQKSGRIVQLETLQSLRELHMRLMYSILRQLGRGENLHETMRIVHANSSDHHI